MSGVPVILVGAGGHARVLLDALVLSGTTVLGLVDSDPGLAGRKVLGFEVLGGDGGGNPKAVAQIGRDDGT